MLDVLMGTLSSSKDVSEDDFGVHLAEVRVMVASGGL
jgi:hypothetical protein